MLINVVENNIKKDIKVKNKDDMEDKKRKEKKGTSIMNKKKEKNRAKENLQVTGKTDENRHRQY